MSDDSEKEVQEFITPEDLATIKQVKTKVGFCALRAEKALVEAENAQLEEKNIILNIYIKYGLTLHHKIDETTGKIMKKEIKNESK